MAASHYQLTITMSDPTGATPRMWIDDLSDCSPDTEQQLMLARCAEGVWTASFVCPPLPDDILMFRIWLTGVPGSRWLLQIESDDELVYEDGDALSLAKEWVVGTVCAPASERASDCSIAGVAPSLG